jgi:hypothetical protein
MLDNYFFAKKQKLSVSCTNVNLESEDKSSARESVCTLANTFFVSANICFSLRRYKIFQNIFFALIFFFGLKLMICCWKQQNYISFAWNFNIKTTFYDK